jgi:hypothetical protein
VTDDDFDVRLGQVERAIAVINTIENNPDLQAAAFSHLFGTAPSLRGDVIEEAPLVEEAAPAVQATASGEPAKRTNGGAKRARKAPASVPHDKTLNIAPAGKQSWVEFVAEKQPVTLHEKYVACVYWLLDVAELDKATINQIVTLFITSRWTLPKDPRNHASQASGAGYLDSADKSDLKLTSLGTALILNDLPRAAK